MRSCSSPVTAEIEPNFTFLAPQYSSQNKHTHHSRTLARLQQQANHMHECTYPNTPWHTTGRIQTNTNVHTPKYTEIHTKTHTNEHKLACVSGLLRTSVHCWMVVKVATAPAAMGPAATMATASPSPSS